MDACKFDAREDALLGGRFKKVRHAVELRHRESSELFMVRRYASSPLRRSSRNVGLDVVFVNQDFGGKGTGGGRST